MHIRECSFLYFIYDVVLSFNLELRKRDKKRKIVKEENSKRKIIYKYYFRSLNYHVITFDYRSYGDSSQIGTKVQNINLKERKIIMWLCQGFIFEILSMDKTANTESFPTCYTYICMAISIYFSIYVPRTSPCGLFPSFYLSNYIYLILPI